jgi:hypothetical protein
MTRRDYRDPLLWALISVGVLFAILLLVPAVSMAQAVLSCTGATFNTDGSMVLGPLQFTWYHGTSSTSLTDKAGGLQACGYTWPNLPAGQHFFAATNTDMLGRESVHSNVVSWTGGTGGTVLPNPPTNATVQPSNLKAYSPSKSGGSMVVAVIGTVPAGTPCDTTQGVLVGSVMYFIVPRSAVTPANNNLTAVVAQCG